MVPVRWRSFVPLGILQRASQRSSSRRVQNLLPAPLKDYMSHHRIPISNYDFVILSSLSEVRYPAFSIQVHVFRAYRRDSSERTKDLVVDGSIVAARIVILSGYALPSAGFALEASKATQHSIGPALPMTALR